MLSINFGKVTEKLCDEYCNGFNDGLKHVEGMVDWVKNRIDNKFVNFLALPQNKKNLTELTQLSTELTTGKILSILRGKPSELILLSENEFKAYKNLDFTYSYTINKSKKFKKVKVLYYLFNYDSFRGITDENQFSGFELSKKLGIDCCPYCNRHYTSTSIVYTSKKVFPEFDHFYHKSRYPLLAISFYNLIPSCNVCNTHFKGAKDTVAYNIFHPYTSVKSNHFNFKDFPNDVKSLYGHGSNVTLKINYNESSIENTRLKNSIEFFGIIDLYEKSHSDQIKEWIYRKLAVGNSYMDQLQKSYKMSFEDSYRIVYETNFEEEKLHKRPFSKLKKDIYNKR